MSYLLTRFIGCLIGSKISHSTYKNKKKILSEATTLTPNDGILLSNDKYPIIQFL